MDDTVTSGKERKSFTEHWTVATLVGSFLLYLLGYLVTRFQLTVLGVGANLDVVEEKYFFSGAKFAVYLVATLPSLLLLLLLPAALGGLAWRLVPASKRKSAVLWLRTKAPGPLALHLLGTVIAVVAIQFVMRQCFLFSNLLLARQLPGPAWLQGLLLDHDEALTALYFAGLVTSVAFTFLLWLSGSTRPDQTPASRFLGWLVLGLLALQLLFLPINYATLVLNKSFPRLAALGTQPLVAGQRAWLIWENAGSATFLVSKGEAPGDERAIVTLPAKEIERLDILAYDPLLRILFSNPVRDAPPASAPK